MRAVIGRVVSAAAAVGMGLSAAAAIAAGALWLSGAELKINQTPSIARGIYIRDDKPIVRGSLVWFPMPESMASYVASFPSGTAYFADQRNGLLKPVVGIAGERICRDGATVTVNGITVTALPYGPSVAPLPAWSGCQTIGEGEVAVIAMRIPDALDSRYFGPVRGGVAYRPLLVEQLP